MRKLILLFISTLIVTSTVIAQNKVTTGTGKITGNILDEKNQPLGFTTIVLLKAQDSTVLKSALSNDNGDFTFDQLADNQYIVSVAHTGYQKHFTSKLSISADNQSVIIPTIVLAL